MKRIVVQASISQELWDDPEATIAFIPQMLNELATMAGQEHRYLAGNFDSQASRRTNYEDKPFWKFWRRPHSWTTYDLRFTAGTKPK